MNDIKTLGLNNPETYVLTHNRFNTCLISYFSDLNKTQVYKMPCRVSSHDEIEIIMSFDYLILFNQTNTQKIITLENKMMQIFYLKSEIKTIFIMEIK